MSEPETRTFTAEEATARILGVEARLTNLGDRFRLEHDVDGHHLARTRAVRRSVSWWSATSSYDRIQYLMVVVMVGWLALDLFKILRVSPLEEG